MIKNSHAFLKFFYLDLIFRYWQLVLDVWAEYSIIDPAFAASSPNVLSPTKEIFLSTYTPLEASDFVAFVITSISQKHQHRESSDTATTVFHMFLTALSALAAR